MNSTPDQERRRTGSEQGYDINLEDKFGSRVIDLPAEIAAHEPWFN